MERACWVILPPRQAYVRSFIFYVIWFTKQITPTHPNHHAITDLSLSFFSLMKQTEICVSRPTKSEQQRISTAAIFLCLRPKIIEPQPQKSSFCPNVAAKTVAEGPGWAHADQGKLSRRPSKSICRLGRGRNEHGWLRGPHGKRPGGASWLRGRVAEKGALWSTVSHSEEYRHLPRVSQLEPPGKLNSMDIP